MASDNHASYARIGFTVFIGITAIVAALIYLGGIRGRDSEVYVETCYDKPVSGLSVGSVVNFRGVKVGEVREISFIGNKYEADGAENSRIYILMALKAESFGRGEDNREFLRANINKFVAERGLRATVTSSGITGLSRIELNFHRPEELTDEMDISWTPTLPYIPPKMSLLENFSVAATKVMNQINKMDIASVWSNISWSVESLARMSDGAKTMLESRQGDIEQIADNLTQATASLRDLSIQLKNNPSLLIRERTPGRLKETE